MSIQPSDENSRPEAREPSRYEQFKSVGAKFAKAPQGAASVVRETSRAAYGYTSRTVGEIKEGDLRLRTNPVDLAQAVTNTARVTMRVLPGAAATQIGKATTTAATKATEVAGTAASEIGKAIGIGTTGIIEHSRAFHTRCREPLASLSRRAGDSAVGIDEWARAAAVAAWGALLTLQEAVPTFGDLPIAMKAKFVMAGMHGAWRTVDAAAAFYESSIPSAVRNLGEDAVAKFLDGKHAGHIEAVVNAPERMMDAANIVWEAARDNLARGGADMTPLELAKANALNTLDAAGIVITEALQTAAAAGCIGMGLEAVVSVSENLIYVYKDVLTVEEARRKVLRDVLKRGKAAAIGGAGVTVAVALGAGPALATAAPVLVSVGGVLYIVTAYSRIKTALDSSEESPDTSPLESPSPALGTA